MERNRDQAWTALASEPFDLLIVGGGVTGAAVLFEAARRGLRAALVERGDYASGTSSRSSKLVHGGLRYLKEGKIGLTRESVRERQELLRGAPGLVDPIPFLMPHYAGRKPGRAVLGAGLALYDMLGGAWQHRFAGRDETLGMVPLLDSAGLTGAHCYLDATTDDARLVLRLIQEACDEGAVALNYASGEPLLDGEVLRGLRVTETVTGRRADVRAAAVVAATGVFADALRARISQPPRLRPLRGSHVVIADWRLPLAQSVAFEHPADRRPVFAYPWMGKTLVGTTDLDHDGDLDDEPAITRAETSYLLDALRFAFPSAHIDSADVVSTYAGIRPIVNERGATAPSRASRDHAVWNERGLITITGGKLTTFRPMALDALRAAAPKLPGYDTSVRPVFETAATPAKATAVLGASGALRLSGRFGARANEVLHNAPASDLERIGGSDFTWAELRWSVRHEHVVHLDDLLLRRTRIGLVLQHGGAAHFDRIGDICRRDAGWDDARWHAERDAYAQRWLAHYGVPAAS